MESPTVSDEALSQNATDTMRTLVGVDGDDLYLPALDLLGRLRFSGNRLTLAHIDPPVGPTLEATPVVYMDYDERDLVARAQAVAGTLLDCALHEAENRGLGNRVETVHEFGSTSLSLMRMARTRHVDLVAIGSNLLGPLASAFLGSVGRALAIGADVSFLVARGRSTRQGGVHAVFATDHSNYADRCLRRLMDMDPQGLRKITLLTAVDPRYERRIARASGLSLEEPDVLSRAEDRLRERGERLAQRWRERDVEAEVRLVEGHPAEAIRRTMEETGADLLVLGARGHGLIERVLIGSLALHAAVAETYPVLVVRLGEDA